jgi:hypothetical protein
VRLLIIGTRVLIVPSFMLLLFKALALLALVFNLAVCISAVDGIVQISVIPVSSSAVFLQRSETSCESHVDFAGGQARDTVLHHHGRALGQPWLLRPASPRGASRVR